MKLQVRQSREARQHSVCLSLNPLYWNLNSISFCVSNTSVIAYDMQTVPR